MLQPPGLAAAKRKDVCVCGGDHGEGVGGPETFLSVSPYFGGRWKFILAAASNLRLRQRLLTLASDICLNFISDLLSADLNARLAPAALQTAQSRAS